MKYTLKELKLSVILLLSFAITGCKLVSKDPQPVPIPTVTSNAAHVFVENPRVDSQNLGLAFTSDLKGMGKSVTLAGLDGSGNLSNKIYSVTVDSLYSIANRSTGFNFDPDDARFEQVCAYYNSYRLKTLIDSQGQDLSQMQTVYIDSHCNYLNNAYFNPSTHTVCLGVVEYVAGSKYVWAADDSDVTIHESGHGMNHYFANSETFYSSGEAGDMDEGFADYWAHTINSANTKLSEWFLESIESLYNVTDVSRDVADDHLYPSSLIYEIHADSRPFMESLWQFRKLLGQSLSDQLVIRTIKLLPAVARYKDGVQAIQDAAAQLNLSADQISSINTTLTNKGLLRTDSAAGLQLSTNNAHFPIYVMDDHQYSWQSNGNCNGVLDEGETALVLVNLGNNGAAMGMGNLAVSTSEANISIPAGGNVGEYFRLDAGQDFVSTLNASASILKQNATVAAGFIVTANTGAAGVRNFSLTYTPINSAPVTIPFSITVGTAGAKSTCVNNGLWP